MRDERGRQDQKSAGMLALVFAALVLLFAIIVWGPWNNPHVESNPGPNGTPGSTAAHEAPPPAAGPSGTTTGAAR
jgi:hypothetical protein